MLTLKELDESAFNYLNTELDSIVVTDLTPKELTRLGVVIAELIKYCNKFSQIEPKWIELNGKARDKLFAIINFYDIIGLEKSKFETANEIRVLTKISALYQEELRDIEGKRESIVDNQETANAILEG